MTTTTPTPAATTTVAAVPAVLRATTTADVDERARAAGSLTQLGIIDEHVQLRIAEHRRRHGKISAAAVDAVVSILRDDAAVQLDPLNALDLAERIVPAVLAQTRRSRSGRVES